MPIVTINMLEGRQPEKKTELIKRVTEVISEVLDSPPERIRIIINEMKNEDYGIGGLPVQEFRKRSK